MRVFKVSIAIHIDGYEKTFTKYIQADSEKQAQYEALSSESHNDYPTYEQWLKNPNAQWWDDVFVYEACVIRELSLNEIAAISTIVDFS